MLLRSSFNGLFALSMFLRQGCGIEDGNDTSTPVTTTPNGTYDSAAFSTATSQGFSVLLPAGTGSNASSAPVLQTYVYFSSASGGISTCGSIGVKANSFLVGIVIASSAIPATGSYGFVTSSAGLLPQRFIGEIRKLDASCGPAVESATSGTLTVTASSSASISGTVSLTFPGGTISGAFSSTLCPKDLGEFGSLDTPACLP